MKRNTIFFLHLNQDDKRFDMLLAVWSLPNIGVTTFGDDVSTEE